MIHVFIGTKAQYIKTAPVLAALERAGVEYRLIDSGQHGTLAGAFGRELGVREPDVRLGGTGDVATLVQAIGWTFGLGRRLLSKQRLMDQVFGGLGGVCLVHGDTPSTLLSALMARRAGLAVAHLEAGLSSGHWTHPFPEELIRRMVARWSHLLFAPGEEEAERLRSMRVRGRIVALPANTVVETMADPAGAETTGGSVIVTMHRVENLYRRSRVEGMVNLVERVAAQRRVCWFLHDPTRRALGRSRLERLEKARVEVSGLIGRSEFVRRLAGAPFVITDGGSVQEECAVLGVPTLLWRGHTERSDGVGENVVVSGYSPSVIEGFLDDPERLRRPPLLPDVRPSERVVEVLAEWR